MAYAVQRADGVHGDNSRGRKASLALLLASKFKLGVYLEGKSTAIKTGIDIFVRPTTKPPRVDATLPGRRNCAVQKAASGTKRLSERGAERRRR